MNTFATLLVAFAILVPLSYGAPPISFDNGNIGVNFAGYHASAGLGGLLGGGAAGGLHAEAGTPFGQNAAAGLGGVVDGGRTAGGLYAGATAGGGVSAAAGLGGEVAGQGEASYGHHTVQKSAQVISEKSYTSEPKVVAERTVQAAPVVHRTIIEKTVIPQYVEKTVQVPSYVEKTIRVPTVEEHKVRVPVKPKVVEKTYDEGAVVHKGAGAQFNAAGGGGHYGGAAVGGGGYGGGYYKSGTLFNDIFNIPISALGAVNNLLNGIAGGGGGGGFGFSKHFSAGANI